MMRSCICVSEVRNHNRTKRAQIEDGTNLVYENGFV